MTTIVFLLLILLGASCGALAEFILGWSWRGFIASAAVGFIGTAMGDWFAPLAAFPALLPVRIEGHTVDIFWSVVGAIAFLVMMSVFRRSSYYRRPLA
jgi:uncharacterized membrane protein YeaQ/YmgE (transglycosylase-associated protein family)